MSNEQVSKIVQTVQTVKTVADIKSHVATIHAVMDSVMKAGTHYDTIKGCGDKPVLLKAGAEKILTTFMLAPEFIVEDLSTELNRYYRVITRLTHQSTGIFMGTGIGECSSLETKYAWRASVCDEEFEETPDNMRRVHYKKGWNNQPPTRIKQVRQDMHTVSNTVLKMAKKRSLVDAVMNVTACSDIFVQDLDESHIVEATQGEEPPPAKAPTITKAAILAAFKACKDVDYLKAKYNKALSTEFAEDPEVLQAFKDRHKELS